MCAGAVINARLSTVIYGAKEPRSGSVGSVINLFEENYGHRPAVYGGVLSEDCARLLAEFFPRHKMKKPPAPRERDRRRSCGWVVNLGRSRPR